MNEEQDIAPFLLQMGKEGQNARPHWQVRAEDCADAATRLLALATLKDTVLQMHINNSFFVTEPIVKNQNQDK